MTEVDLVNRDPNHINQGLAVSFEEVIAEPDAVHSIDCLWKLAFTCFNCWLGLCYKLSTLICGVCLSMYWASEFAHTAVLHIWWITPCLRLFEINCMVFRKINMTICGCLVEPCCIACSAIFKSFEGRK